MDSIDTNKILELLRSINKDDLKKAVSQANSIMNSKDKNEIINDLKNKIK